MSEKYQALLDKVYEIYDLEKATRVLIWDRDTNMPPGGDTARVQQITTLRRLSHHLYTADEMGELIEAADAELTDLPPTSTEASLIRFLRRDYDNARKQPPDLVARIAEVSGRARGVWKQARAEANFAAFRPWLEQIVVLEQERAELFGYQDDPYDALLDKQEPGIKTAGVRAVFNAVKAATVDLLAAIQERGQPIDDTFLYQPYDIEQQRMFAHYVAAAVGYDFNRGHLAGAPHPFSTGFARDDVRITSRWYPHYLSPSIFATLHETGHAIYEQNTDPALTRTPLARDTSTGIDESQSRLVENMIGRSRGFWLVHLPALQQQFPQQLAGVTAEAFYKAVNKVKPGYIRVEADELTYNLHIILRFELEQAMLNGDLAVADLPAAWNDKMRALLGVVPPTDREGCLQDIHWTWPSFGYFPTYALGNFYAAQLYEAALVQNPGLAQEIASGNFTGLLAWMRRHIHQHGRKLAPADLIQQATGRPLSHEAFVRYVTEKFSEIYQL
jgi:carboxypeptidase Taq